MKRVVYCMKLVAWDAPKFYCSLNMCRWEQSVSFDVCTKAEIILTVDSDRRWFVEYPTSHAGNDPLYGIVYLDVPWFVV